VQLADTRNRGARLRGSIVMRSFAPLPSRTTISPRVNSTSFTRSRTPSMMRIPEP
jgi:hypothetical protein